MNMQTIFQEIYPAKMFKYGRYEFAYDQYIDETLVGAASGGVRLHFVTADSDYYSVPKEKLIMDSYANFEAIVLLSDEIPYFEEPEQTRTVRESAKALLDKAIANGTFYVYGEMVELKWGDAKSKLDAVLTRLIESVYSKLNYINVFCEDDIDIWQIVNGDEEQIGEQIFVPGTGANNEYALNEISQWLERQASNHVPVSMGDVQRKYQAIPYGWREMDIAALVARLLADQKITVQYEGEYVARDDQMLADYLYNEAEIDKTVVTRRIALSEELISKSAAFLRDWLGQADIPDDGEGLIRFVRSILKNEEAYCNNLLKKEYARDHYPEKEVVAGMHAIIIDILSQSRDNTAMLNRLIARQDDLRNGMKEMESVRTFFEPKLRQKVIFDAARALEKSLQDDRDHFVADADTGDKIKEMSEILAMPKPYARIKDLTELTQRVREVYETWVSRKKDEVGNLIIQCRGDVHTLAGTGAMVRDEVTKADERFTGFKQKVADAASLAVLDAIITQLINYRDTACKEIEFILAEILAQQGGGGASKPQNIVQVRRYEIFPMRRLQSREDIDNYLDSVRTKLYDTLEGNDGVQIN